MQIELNEEAFKESLQVAPVVLLYFTSDFCGPCRMMSGLLEEISETSGEKLALATIRGIDQPSWMTAFNIQSTPTVLLFAKGQFVSRMTGARPRSVVQRWIETYTV
ncbi:Thioredoxin [Alkalibacterium sp. AK22]|uniref:thioredoxin family protein n=1 Tax=Alkalibacterium sp. AK22 TaxID=1229520 RepID=UPI000447C406|nr:thioredoxin family protein [Alkalibacterium sp. AK22]EXJ22738.1 Thioredoxin [Alkalibacterium sp. AK22]